MQKEPASAVPQKISEQNRTETNSVGAEMKLTGWKLIPAKMEMLKMKNFDPSTCNGKCEECQFDDRCDHVMLTDTQKYMCSACGCFFTIILVLAFTIFAIGVSGL